MEDILIFLSDLSRNNNREWFTEHKSEYLRCRDTFEKFTERYIEGLAAIDPRIKNLKAKDCMWRIYRDVRFSADKRPYKEWFGTFPAPRGGKRSPMAGYYCHLQPKNCLFAAGIWGPDAKLLYHLRTDINDNYEEVEKIMRNRNFKRYFSDFDTDYMLKKVPMGFNPDCPHPDWLKRKCYTISTHFTDEQVCSPDFLDQILTVAAAAKPMNDFLNYSVEEYMGSNQ